MKHKKAEPIGTTYVKWNEPGTVLTSFASLRFPWKSPESPSCNALKQLIISQELIDCKSYKSARGKREKKEQNKEGWKRGKREKRDTLDG